MVQEYLFEGQCLAFRGQHLAVKGVALAIRGYRLAVSGARVAFRGQTGIPAFPAKYCKSLYPNRIETLCNSLSLTSQPCFTDFQLGYPVFPEGLCFPARRDKSDSQ
jgi:hypothetical protein